MGWLKLILGVHRWILISRVRDVDAAEARFFVNALSGLFLFLLFHTMDIFNNTDVCQRPKRAFFISTSPAGVRSTQAPSAACVNALNGLSSFLQYMSPIQTMNI